MYGGDCDAAIAKAATAVTHVQSQSQEVGSCDRSHRHTYAVCVFVRVFYNFPWERSGTTDLSRRPKIFVKAAI